VKRALVAALVLAGCATSRHLVTRSKDCDEKCAATWPGEKLEPKVVDGTCTCKTLFMTAHLRAVPSMFNP
jgi:hypothetical protein